MTVRVGLRCRRDRPDPCDAEVIQRPPAGTIPDAPGSYQFKDAHGRVIYVGKAKSLRSRVGNYFQNPANLHSRTAQMVATAETVEWIQVRNDVEALMLEYSLIKQHQPRFNIRLKDDKSFPLSSPGTRSWASRACCSTSRSARDRVSARSTRWPTTPWCKNCSTSSTVTPTRSFDLAYAQLQGLPDTPTEKRFGE